MEPKNNFETPCNMQWEEISWPSFRNVPWSHCQIRKSFFITPFTSSAYIFITPLRSLKFFMTPHSPPTPQSQSQYLWPLHKSYGGGETGFFRVTQNYTFFIPHPAISPIAYPNPFVDKWICLSDGRDCPSRWCQRWQFTGNRLSTTFHLTLIPRPSITQYNRAGKK